jgi:hypothetical protein
MKWQNEVFLCQKHQPNLLIFHPLIFCSSINEFNVSSVIFLHLFYHFYISSIPIVQATGKLDKNALPPFDKDSSDEDQSLMSPSTETEKIVSVMWINVLKMRHVDIEESFFDLGG